MEWSRLYVMGPPESGKTAVVRELLGEEYTSPPSPSISFSSSGSLSSLSSPSSSTSSSPQVYVHRWKKCNPDLPEAIAGIEVWDLPGSQNFQEANLLYLTEPCTVLLVIGVEHSVDDMLYTFSAAVNKCPKGRFLMVLTHRGQMTDDEIHKRSKLNSSAVRDWIEATRQLLEEHVERIKNDITDGYAQRAESGPKNHPDQKTLINRASGGLHSLLGQKIELNERVFVLGLNSGEGNHTLRQAVLDTISDQQNHHRDADSTIKMLLTMIIELRASNLVVLPDEEFIHMVLNRLTSTQGKDSKEIDFNDKVLQLHSMGYILYFKLLAQDGAAGPVDSTATSLEKPQKAPPKRGSAKSTPQTNRISSSKGPERRKSSKTNDQMHGFVCINPEAFANMVCSCIIDDNKRVFRLEAGRFWPAESGFQTPDAYSLARVLEDIPGHAIIREAIFPLLWQDYDLNESQIKHSINLLQRLGVLNEHEPANSDIAGLAMPDFLGLSPVNCYRLMLMDLVPNIKPQLNWTSKPYRGDLQIVWRIRVLTIVPASVMKRALVLMKWTSRSLCHYTYIWKEGILIKFNEVNICCELSGSQLDIYARVNGDEPGQEDVAVRLLWAHLIPLVLVLEQFLHNELPGAALRESIMMHGNVFYNMETSPQEDIEISLERCLLCWQLNNGYMPVLCGKETKTIDLTVLLPFKGEETKSIWTAQDWKTFMMSKRATILDQQTKISAPAASTAGDRKRRVSRNGSRRSTGKKKMISVTWKTTMVEDLEELASTSSEKDDSQLQSLITQPNSHVPDTSISEETAPIPTVSEEIFTTKLSQEDIQRERLEVAVRLVSAMMAAGVAKFVSTCSSLYTDGASRAFTHAEISAAQATADAAMSVYNGSLDGAARAVIDVLHAAQSQSTSKSHGLSSNEVRSSKTCALL